MNQPGGCIFHHPSRSNIMLLPSMTSHQKTVTNEKPQGPDKWFNEYPLEWDPNRLAVVITNLLSKSPRLIGWDDEEIEWIALDADPTAGYHDEEDICIGPK